MFSLQPKSQTLDLIQVLNIVFGEEMPLMTGMDELLSPSLSIQATNNLPHNVYLKRQQLRT